MTQLKFLTNLKIFFQMNYSFITKILLFPIWNAIKIIINYNNQLKKASFIYNLLTFLFKMFSIFNILVLSGTVIYFTEFQIDDFINYFNLIYIYMLDNYHSLIKYIISKFENQLPIPNTNEISEEVLDNSNSKTDENVVDRTNSKSKTFYYLGGFIILFASGAIIYIYKDDITTLFVTSGASSLCYSIKDYILGTSDNPFPGPTGDTDTPPINLDDIRDLNSNISPTSSSSS